jgi:hypothetical protein
MILTKLKLWAIGIGGLLIAGLLATVRVLSARNSRLSRKVENQEARLKHAKNVLIGDKEADEQADVHLSDVAHEIEEGKDPDELKNPNNW